MTDPQLRPLTDPIDLAAHRAEARAGGVDDLVHFVEVLTREAVLHAAVAGPASGEPVVMLHGFPDLWLSWTHQIRPLVQAGYRVILPDQRGYNRSSRPRATSAYALPALGQDILDLLDAFDLRDRPVHLVGHDWGGAVSWWLAEHHPERWRTLTVLNCPPVSVLGRAARTDVQQVKKSWYILFFLIPLVPELLASAGRGRWLVAALRAGARADAFPDEEIAVYREAWTQPGAARGMIAWYRAAWRGVLRPNGDGRVSVPTTLVWGERDVALRTALIAPTAARCDQVDVVRVPTAGHWVHREAVDEVNRVLLAAIGGGVEAAEAVDETPSDAPELADVER